MRGGKPGAFPNFSDRPDLIPHPVPLNLYDPFGFNANASEEAKASGLIKEINNGRLAMFGILGFLAAQKVDGSVPLLTGVVPPYAGEVMAPVSTRILLIGCRNGVLSSLGIQPFFLYCSSSNARSQGRRRERVVGSRHDCVKPAHVQDAQDERKIRHKSLLFWHVISINYSNQVLQTHTCTYCVMSLPCVHHPPLLVVHLHR